MPTSSSYDPRQHLSFGDISVDSLQNPQLVRVHLRHSKTDQLGRGADIFLGRTDDHLCPVAAILAYLAVRGDSAGPLFRRANGLPLTKTWFIAEVREALSVLGHNQCHYSKHSFGNGRRRSRHRGLNHTNPRAMEQRRVSLLYVCISREHLALLSKRLTSAAGAKQDTVAASVARVAQI